MRAGRARRRAHNNKPRVDTLPARRGVIARVLGHIHVRRLRARGLRRRRRAPVQEQVNEGRLGAGVPGAATRAVTLRRRVSRALACAPCRSQCCRSQNSAACGAQTCVDRRTGHCCALAHGACRGDTHHIHAHMDPATQFNLKIGSRTHATHVDSCRAACGLISPPEMNPRMCR